MAAPNSGTEHGPIWTFIYSWSCSHFGKQIELSYKAKHTYILSNYEIHRYLPKKLKVMFTQKLYMGGCK